MEFRKRIKLFQLNSWEKYPYSDGEKQTMRQVFYNHLILQNICKFLKYRDFKVFRLVCSDWKTVSDNIFKKQSKIVLGFKDNKDIREKVDKEGHPDLNMFFLTLMSDFPTTLSALEFRHAIPWNTDILTEFFTRQLGRFITELNISTPIFIDKNGKELENVNINTLLPCTLKKLKVTCDPQKPLKVSLSLHTLSSVECLCLFYCRVHYSNGDKISPKELNLNCVTYICNGQVQNEVIINSFVEFHNLKKIHLEDFNVKVDMSTEEIILEELSLRSTKSILNLADSKWKIHRVNLVELKHSAVHLNINSIATRYTDVDMLKLPENVEKVKFVWPTSIKNCATLPNLKHIEIEGRPGLKININVIPQSVSEMTIANNVSFEGDCVCILEKLKLTQQTIDASLDFLKTTLLSLRPKHLILEILGSWTTEALDSLAEFIISHQSGDRTDFLQSFTVGGLTGSKRPASFSQLVDKEAGKYVFKNGKGIAISRYYNYQALSLRTMLETFH